MWSRSTKFRVQGVELISVGTGYTTAPAVAFIGGGGSGAAATTIIGDGILSEVRIQNAGSNYYEAPTVTVSAPGSGLARTSKGTCWCWWNHFRFLYY